MDGLIKNRLAPVILSAANMTFLICFRGKDELFGSLAWLGVYRKLGFLLLGITLVWAVYACSAGKRYLCLKAAIIGTAYIFFQKAYNLLTAREIYRIGKKWQFAGVAAGILAGWILIKLIERYAQKKEQSPGDISLEPLSRCRGCLMGIAMLCVMFFHTIYTGAGYRGLLWNIVYRFYFGVDIFLFLSGLGMVFSLSRDQGVLNFYRKRILKIFPEYVPWVGAYTLAGIFMGQCGFAMLAGNCLAVSYWFSDSEWAFNWYIPALVVFYLLTPWIFRLYKNTENRCSLTAVLFALSVLWMVVLYDNGQGRLMMAVSRFPVFLTGIVAGFWLKEKKTFTKAEYVSAIAIMCLGIVAVFRISSKFPAIAWKWLPYCMIIPALCLFLARIMVHVGEENFVMRFLKWLGANSLSVYLLNVITVRFSGMFVNPRLKGNVWGGLAYSYGMILFDLLLIFLIGRIKAKVMRHSSPSG